MPIKTIKAWIVVWKDYFFACPEKEEAKFFKDWIEAKKKKKTGKVIQCEIKIKK